MKDEEPSLFGLITGAINGSIQLEKSGVADAREQFKKIFKFIGGFVETATEWESTVDQDIIDNLSDDEFIELLKRMEGAL